MSRRRVLCGDGGARHRCGPNGSPGSPRRPHWYTVERFQALLAAYLSEDPAPGPGAVCAPGRLSPNLPASKGTAAQKAVTADVGLSRHLAGRLGGQRPGWIWSPCAGPCSKAMQERSRLIKPAALGVLGDTHLRTILVWRGSRSNRRASSTRSMKRDCGRPPVCPGASVRLVCGFWSPYAGAEAPGLELYPSLT